MATSSSSQRYRFVAGLGDESQLREINAMAESGYKVIHMIYNESEIGSNKHVLALMELESYSPEPGFAQEYRR